MRARFLAWWRLGMCRCGHEREVHVHTATRGQATYCSLCDVTWTNGRRVADCPRYRRDWSYRDEG